jgi:hypothetical protein
MRYIGIAIAGAIAGVIYAAVAWSIHVICAC